MTMNPTQRRGTPILVLLLAVLTLPLPGCGGAQETGTAPPPPAPAPATAPDTVAPPQGAPGPRGTAVVAGRVRYEGEVPALRPLQMDADPGCAKKHATPPTNEMLVLGEGQTLANVFVRVKGGLPGGRYPAPAEAAVIDQHGCQYVPHVLGVMAGQKVRILNSDGLLHNVHALPKVNKEFNMAMPASRTETEVSFDQEEVMFQVKCDVHPWMGAWIGVVTHPFFAVTGTDGLFRLEGLPAGSYEIEAWHERLGTQTLSVDAADGQGVELEVTFKK
jgi:plastocyanin